jgi:hypothetical protein
MGLTICGSVGWEWGSATTQTLAGSCLKMNSRHSSLEHISVGLKRIIGLTTSVTLPQMYFFLLSSSSIDVEGSYLNTSCSSWIKACWGGGRSRPKQEACPNCLGNQETWEPRKPVPLGTMFRNGVECISGILGLQDVVQDVEVMKQKEYFGEKSSVLNGMEIPAHKAEVLRQINGANVVEGGWVGVNARFGSMVAGLEAKKRLNVNSTWIIKGNHAFYPFAALHAVIKARFGTKIAGH